MWFNGPDALLGLAIIAVLGALCIYWITNSSRL